jgi:hypothetical protein
MAMAFLAEIYSEDADFLAELAAEAGDLVAGARPPAPVEAPGSLDLDLATVTGQIWELVVAFGSVKASLEVVELAAKLLRRRKPADQSTTVEFLLADGVKVTLAGSMTPAEVAATLAEYRRKAAELDPR